MVATYDGIIVGAGVMGANTALQLASAGLTRLLMLEKAPGVGFGSTGKSSAIFRQTYSHYETCLMARESLQIIRNWQDFTGLKSTRADFRNSGVVFLLSQEGRAVEEVLSIHRRAGVVSEVLDAQARARLMPDFSFCSAYLDLDAEAHECQEGLTAIYEPEGGFADPVGTTEDLLEVARGLGVELRFKARVTQVLQSGGRVSGVEVEQDGNLETVHAPLVINCAGPWAMGLNELAGVPLAERIVPIRAQKLAKRHPERLRAPLPVVNDLINGINIRPDATGTQIFMSSFREHHSHEEVPDPDHYNDWADAPFREEVLTLAHHRIPTFQARGEITSYAGLYTVNLEDNHPVIDETELQGFFILCGFSGHGFKLSPVVGMLIAQKVLGQWGRGKTDVPLNFFDRNRDPLRSFWSGFFT
ncbi:MAG: FAD-dependent oxidoreductase [SAR324 cluster bacterium]|nr:FAD-dependent oxidoreductase [SAR324 cluster bacterium]MCZ6628687.1 FAD-dependent oxidoreductase [SAR324 cluster bacterium]